VRKLDDKIRKDNLSVDPTADESEFKKYFLGVLKDMKPIREEGCRALLERYKDAKQELGAIEADLVSDAGDPTRQLGKNSECEQNPGLTLTVDCTTFDAQICELEQESLRHKSGEDPQKISDLEIRAKYLVELSIKIKFKKEQILENYKKINRFSDEELAKVQHANGEKIEIKKTIESLKTDLLQKQKIILLKDPTLKKYNNNIGNPFPPTK
jgi:hypothetical protein